MDRWEDFSSIFTAEGRVGLIKDVVVTLTRSFGGGVLFSALKPAQNTGKNNMIAKEVLTLVTISPDDDGGGDEPGGSDTSGYKKTT